MCKAFSCIVMKEKKAGKIQVFWKMGLDSHESILSEFKISDSKDTTEFVRCEVSPKNENYLNPDKWVFKVDENSIPDWFSPAHKDDVNKIFKTFKKELYKIVIRKQIVHPFKLKMVKRVTLKHKILLKQWDSVCDSVCGSVWDSIRDSVWGSVRDSVWGYTSSFFRLKREQWKHTEKIKTNGNPFQSVIDLWEMGLVPSFDGTTWRLHSGNKAKIVFSITKDELMKLKEE